MEKITWKIRTIFLGIIIVVFTANAYAIGVWPTEILPHPPHFPTPDVPKEPKDLPIN